MKEKYTVPAYGLGSWRKTDTFSRNVYDFSGKKSWIDKAIEFLVWSGMAAICVAAVVMFF